MMIKRLLLLCFVGCVLQLDAQQIHFTQFNFAPMNVNPALTGSFSGTARVSGIFRDQYFAGQTNKNSPFVNLGLSAEYNALRGFGKFDWIAIGINQSSSNSGGGTTEGESALVPRFKLNNSNLNLVYHIGLGKKGSSVFSIGAQYSLFSRALSNGNSLWSESDLIAGNPASFAAVVSQTGQDDPNASFSDFAGGLTFTSKTGKSNLFRIGASVNNILGGNQAISTGSGRDDRGLGIIGFVELDNVMNKKTSFKPALLYQRHGQFSKLDAQVKFGFLMNAKKDITLNYGLGYRFGESTQLLLGVDYGRIKAGVSYDFVLGGVRDAARETFELGVSYIFNIEKKPERVPVIFCPRL